MEPCISKLAFLYAYAFFDTGNQAIRRDRKDSSIGRSELRNDVLKNISQSHRLIMLLEMVIKDLEGMLPIDIVTVTNHKRSGNMVLCAAKRIYRTSWSIPRLRIEIL